LVWMHVFQLQIHSRVKQLFLVESFSQHFISGGISLGLTCHHFQQSFCSLHFVLELMCMLMCMSMCLPMSKEGDTEHSKAKDNKKYLPQSLGRDVQLMR